MAEPVMSPDTVSMKRRQLLSLFDFNTSSGVRMAGLDGLRGLAAAMVFVSHVYQYSDHPNFAFITPLVRYAGQGGVILFFVLSGFLMALPWHARRAGSPEPKVTEFAKRRVLRIVPAYYVSVLLLMAGARVTGHAADFGTLFYHLLFLPVLGAGALTAVYWTLQAEAYFYLLVPTFARRRSTWLPLLVATAISGSYFAIVMLFVHDPQTRHILLKQMPFYLVVFILGMTTARIWASGSDWMASHGRLLMVGAFAGYAVVSTIAVAFIEGDGLDNRVSTKVMNVVLAPFAAMLVLAVARGDGVFFRNAAVRLLGAISYSLYLWHLVIIIRMPAPDAVAHNFFYLFISAGLASLVVAVGSFLLIERPFLLWSRGINPLKNRLGLQFSSVETLGRGSPSNPD